jgi:hypothetical protein
LIPMIQSIPGLRMTGAKFTDHASFNNSHISSI